MKSKKFIYIIALIVSAFLLTTILSSCGDSRNNEDSESTNTSQINLQITSGGANTFTSDDGYVITLTKALVNVGEVEISSSSGEEEDHDHLSLTRHDDPSTGEGATCCFDGPYEFNLLNPLTDLGYVNTNPGTYATLVFSYGEHHHDEMTENIKHEGTIQLAGTAIKDGVEYPFEALLDMEEEVERTSFSLELTRGHSGQVQLFYGVHHWFNGVDISQAPVVDGIYKINSNEAPELAEVMSENARTHVKVDIPEDQ